MAWPPKRAQVHAMVLLNPATGQCFNRSLNGVTSLLTSTNLLGFFPQGMYSVAQVRLTAKGET